MEELIAIRTFGKCRGIDDPEIFYPERSAGRPRRGVDVNAPTPEEEIALQICRQCNVLQRCFEYALQNEVWGVWGGTTERDRQLLRTRINSRRAS